MGGNEARAGSDTIECEFKTYDKLLTMLLVEAR